MDDRRAAARHDLEHARRQARPRRVVAHDGLAQRRRPRRADEVHRAAAEPGPGQARRRTRPARRRDFDERVELRAADLEQVAQRRVARAEQAADLVEVAGLRTRRPPARTRSFSWTMCSPARTRAGPSASRAASSIASVTSRSAVTGGPCRRSWPPRPRTAARRSLYADASSRRGEPEWHTTSATSSSGSRTARCSSDRQSSSSALPVLAERGRELVHQPALDADVAVLGALGQLRERHPVERRQRAPDQRERRRELERGRARQARALRQVRREDAAEPADGDAGVRAAPRRCPRRSRSTSRSLGRSRRGRSRPARRSPRA